MKSMVKKWKKEGKFIFFPSILILMFFLIQSCSKPDLPVHYFPLKDGAEYVYNNGQSRRVIEFFKKEKNYDLFKINNFVDDTVFVMVDYFIKTDSTVYWYGFRSLDFGLVYFEPPIPLLPSVNPEDSVLAVTTTEVRKSADSVNRYKLRIMYYFLGRDKIKTPAGNFDCIHFRYSSHYSGNIPETQLMEISGDWWFARGVGLVKQSGSESVLELTSYEN